MVEMKIRKAFVSQIRAIGRWWNRVILAWWYKDHLVFCGIPFIRIDDAGELEETRVGFNRRGGVVAVEIGPPFISAWAMYMDREPECVTYKGAGWFSLQKGTFTVHALGCGHDLGEHLDE